MTDTITLPRAVIEQVREAFKELDYASEPYVNRAARAALAALNAALAEPDATHPGYILGSHWLETAYSRIAAGEAEDDVLAEVLGERGWAKREPATDKKVAEAYAENTRNLLSRWDHYYEAWRNAERFHGILKEDK